MTTTETCPLWDTPSHPHCQEGQPCFSSWGSTRTAAADTADTAEFIVAPVRIVQGRPYPIRVGAHITYDGLPHVVSAVEGNAYVLRIYPVNQPTLFSWITLAPAAPL